MISYTIKIDGVRTGNVDNLQNVVKQVNYTVTGSEAGQSFQLPVKVILDNPDPQTFVTFENLTEPQVIAWVAELPETVATKMHIATVVEKLVAEASYQENQMPWAPPAPAPQPTPEA